MMYNGGLTEIKVVRVDEKNYMFMLGNHRLFDLVDGVIEYKAPRKKNPLLINPEKLMEKLNSFLNGDNDTG